jgi:hypothetical protein
MSNLLPIRFKFIFLIFLAGFIGFCFPFQASAVSDSGNVVSGPNVYVTSLKINEIKDSQITGQFIVGNNESYYLTDLNYKIQLFQGTEFMKLKLVDSVVATETFFVPPNQTVDKSFTYQYPKNIPNGDYNLRIQIMTGRGGSLGWQGQVVSLKGQNKFLQIMPESSKVLVDGKEYYTLEGIGIDPQKQKAFAYLKVENPGDAITVIPNVKIFNRQVNMSVAKEYQDSPITFAKGETKEIKLEMPKLETPESYLAEVKFLNNNEQVSGTEYFRWVVQGASGKILNVKADRDYFKAGENINLTIESIGPADYSSLGNGSLNVSIYDNDKLVGQISKEVVLNASVVSSEISIPVKNDLISPKIEVKLTTKDGQILDERTINLPMFSDQAKQIQKNKELYPIYLTIAIILLIILIIIGFLFYKFKLKNK